MPSRPPLLRFATSDDVENMVSLRILMQKETNPTADLACDPAFRDRLGEYFRRTLASGEFVAAVAEEDSRLVSVNGMVLYRKPPSIGGSDGLTGYVSNVYTVRDRRGQGLAGALMRILIEHARRLGVEKLHLGATEDGKGVYERVGFGPTRFLAMEMRLLSSPKP